MFTKISSLFMAGVLLLQSAFIGLTSAGRFRLIVPEDWELCPGDGRSVEYTFPENTSKRTVTWKAEPESVATVDEWGRVTAVSVGKAKITATSAGGATDSVELNVVSTPTLMKNGVKKKDYTGKAVNESDVLQKVVTRYTKDSQDIPAEIRNVTDYSGHQKVISKDGAVWQITSYGVLRTNKNEKNERDREMRLMGNRYFYSADTKSPNVLGIFSDGENGIWTVMNAGVTHISMVKMSGEEKADILSDQTQKYVARHGLTSEAYDYRNGKITATQSDNDGLWTSMYGAGELMRYAVLRDSGIASKEEIEKARQIATRTAEALLFLDYVSMRTGTTESYVRLRENMSLHSFETDRRNSSLALLEGGDYSQNITSKSPADDYKYNNVLFDLTNKFTYLKNDSMFAPASADSWADTILNPDENYAKRTKSLGGFVARTFFLKSENEHTYGNIYWSVNSDKTATGVSSNPPTDEDYYLNGENLRGYITDASGKIPDRLWNDIVGSEHTYDEIVYKGDTSADELIGHIFMFKLIYDVLGDEDPELKKILVEAVDSLAQHISDNGYELCDGSGQPATWSRFGRGEFTNSSSISIASLHCEVVLALFKVAAYVTGYQKWENEYQMAALDPQYEYAEVVSQYGERMKTTIKYSGMDEVSPYIGLAVDLLGSTKIYNIILRATTNYSAMEMAMLGFYTLFQLEDNKKILSYYRDAIDEWWEVGSYLENPLWCYIYQLAYPNKKVKDVYGNNILETASWSLGRSPTDCRSYKSSNENRDDITQIDFSALGVDSSNSPSYMIESGEPLGTMDTSNVKSIAEYVLKVLKIKWAIAAPDERMLKKYNGSTYELHSDNSSRIEGSTPYTLPYWMGKYHKMIK